MTYFVATCYTFLPIKKHALASYKRKLVEHAKKHDIEGLILIATEGINMTIAGNKDAIKEYKVFIEHIFGKQMWKESISEKRPFKRFKVKIKKEIVALKDPDASPLATPTKTLSAHEWNKAMQEKDVVIIDVRNWYETKIGMFKNAIDPKTWKFSQFPSFVKKAKIPKDKKILMYCTGDIRCEKAAITMQNEGYDEVYHLEGGILHYLQNCPNEQFEGECYIFDHRVALDQHLAPSSSYRTCPHCGNPGNTKKTCTHCKKDCYTCETCTEHTCSKRCKNEYAAA